MLAHSELVVAAERRHSVCLLLTVGPGVDDQIGRNFCPDIHSGAEIISSAVLHLLFESDGPDDAGPLSHLNLHFAPTIPCVIQKDPKASRWPCDWRPCPPCCHSASWGWIRRS
jgi:hypothetical protein